MNKIPPLSFDTRIYVAGHRGMVGSAILRLLQRQGYRNLITRTSAELDLREQAAVRDFFSNEKVDHVILAAAKVGGIYANNTYPAQFIQQNLLIQNNVIHEAWRAGVEKLLFLGSSCIYPKQAKQPIKEEYLLTGTLEPTNEAYAIAKISGIAMCRAYNRQYGTDYRAVMPTNLYGPGDNYHLENSHVIPAVIRKYHLAKLAAAGDFEAVARDENIFGPIPQELKDVLGLEPSSAHAPYALLWGSGAARREFLHVDDMAAACQHVMSVDRATYIEALAGEVGSDLSASDASFQTPAACINVGCGRDVTIREVAEMIKEIVGFEGKTRYSSDQPDGTPRKLLDISRISSLGWRPVFTLREGLRDVYHWYCRQR